MDWNTAKNKYYRLLLRHSNDGEIYFFQAINVGRKFIIRNVKVLRKLLRDLHFDGKWKWKKDGKMKII